MPRIWKEASGESRQHREDHRNPDYITKGEKHEEGETSQTGRGFEE